MTTGIKSMIKVAGFAAAVAALSSLPVGYAYADGHDLAEKNGCTGCHKLDKKSMGPAFKDIAGKYKGDAAAPAGLVASVKAGSAGKWGTKKMPPQAEASEADVKQIVAWVLSL